MGLIAEDLLDGPVQGGMAVEALDANEPVPGVGPASPPEATPRRDSPTWAAIWGLSWRLKAERMMAARRRSWDCSQKGRFECNGGYPVDVR